MSLSLTPTPPRPVQHEEGCDGEDLMDERTLTPRKSIGWAATKEIFEISPSEFQRTKRAPLGHIRRPRKSILKPSRPLQPYPCEKKRDFTPTPDDALSDTQFLQYPISIITDKTSSLRDLTEAYSILAARIRIAVPASFWLTATSSFFCPLFQPIRANTDAIAAAIKRDLGRIFVDPLEVDENLPPRLPTPRSSPRKSPSKGGFTEEQVKYARDLSTVTAAAIKFLIVAFQSSALYSAFSNKQLSTLLTGVLAIPLADSIRSPSARKICGFTITLLQVQRLPDEVLRGAKDRILFALKRAMEGELGREGKKGSASEAFKAIHDLSLYRPAIFVRGMEHYLSSVLEGLLVPSCALRVQATHALGGLSMAVARSGSDFDDFLRDVSPGVVDFFLRKEEQGSKEQTITKMLRTALRTTEPSHHAQGPLWAVSVLASLTILFGPALLKNLQLLTTFRDLIHLGLRSKKLPFRTATMSIWGSLIWTWQKWRGSPDLLDFDEIEDEADHGHEREEVKASFSQLLMKLNHMQIGVLLFGSMLGANDSSCQRQDVLQIFIELASAVRRFKGEVTGQALAVLERIITIREDEEFYATWEKKHLKRLIPPQLFSVVPGLLTSEMNMASLTLTVEGIVNEQANVEDMRPLSNEERGLKLVFNKSLDVWEACLEQLQLSEHEPVPEVFVDIWAGIVRMGLSSKDEVRTVNLYAEQCSKFLISILANPAIDLRECPQDDSLNGSENIRLKLALLRPLWSTLMSILPTHSHTSAAKHMMSFLVHERETLVAAIAGFEEGDDDVVIPDDEALSDWAELVSQVAAIAGTEFTEKFWRIDLGWDDHARARAWRAFVHGWTEDQRGSWQGAIVLLGRPFGEDSPWDMSDADLSAWQGLLSYAAEGATSDLLTPSQFLEKLTERINRRHILALNSTVRIADILLATFDKSIDHCNVLPSSFLELVHEILVSSYPPPPRNKIGAIWLLRSLVSVVSHCSSSHIVELLETLHDGLITWIADDCTLFTGEEYTSEITPLYQTILVSLQSLPPTTDVLQSLASLITSALHLGSEPGDLTSEREEALTSFSEFWSAECKRLTPPRGGWAECIAQALDLAFPRETSEPEVIEVDSEDELNILVTPKHKRIHKVSLPPSPSPIRIRPVNLPIPIACASSKTNAMRSRRSEPVPLPALFAATPPSPSAQRSKRKHSHTRSASGYSADKENFVPTIGAEDDEVIYVGMKRSPAKAKIVSTPAPLAAKRQRTVTAGSDDSEDMRVVEDAVQVELGSSSPVRVPFAKCSKANETASVVCTPVRQKLPSAIKRARAGTVTEISETGAANAPAQRPVAQARASPAKRRKMSQIRSDKQDSDEEDDDWLPPSSDAESEDSADELESPEEPVPDLIRDSSSSSSSSPVHTPKSQRTQFDARIQVRSFECTGSSSPSHKVRRHSSRIGSLGALAAAPLQTKLPRSFDSIARHALVTVEPTSPLI